MGPPVILQADRSECGLACLAMVAAFFGHQATLREFRSRFRHSSRGITLRRLRDCAEQLGLRCRGVRAELDEIQQLRTPAILHWELDHFVVLKSASRRRITVIDPAVGLRRLKPVDVDEKFTGVAMELMPTPSFAARKSADTMKLSSFLPSLRGLGRPLMATFAMTLVVQLVAIVMPLQVQFTVDQGIRQGDMNLVLALALGFGLLSIVSTLTGYLRSLLLLYVGNTSAFRMVGGLAHHLMRLPDSWFEARHTGDVLSRFGSMAPIRQFLTTGAFAIGVDVLLAIGALTMLLLYSPKLTLVVCGFLTLVALINTLTVGPIRNLTHESIAASALESSSFIENAQRHRAIRLLGAEDDRGDAWSERYVQSMNAGTRLSRFGIHLGLTGSILGSVQSVTLLLLTAGEVIAGAFTLGMLFAFNSYRGMFTARINSIIAAVVGLRMLKLHQERIAEIGLQEPEVAADKPGVLIEMSGRVEMRAIGFAYGDDEPPVLEDFNLEIRPGEFVAVTGASGAGKSTVVKLLCGLLDPVEGEVLIDGVNLRRLEISHFRHQIGVVMQDDDLFSGSLLENIAVGELHPDPDRAVEAAKLACVHEDIGRMPMQYLTLVGQMGASLSGGQRQRVIIARAIYRRPRLLVLDEGTAHLNDELQQRILDNLCAQGMTILAVTHDPRVSDRADRRIFVSPPNQSSISESAA